MAEQGKVVEIEHLKCSSCGGEMTFSPKEGMLVCPYCGMKQELNAEGAASKHRYSRNSRLNTGLVGDNVTAHCDNCGASITVEKTTAALTCPFCTSPIKIEQDATASVVPDGVVLFQISQKEAVHHFKEWIKGRFFSPRKLRQLAKMQKINGVYLPHFLFDCETHSHYTAEAGTHYYVTETVSVQRDGKTVQEQKQVQKTRWTSVSGEYDESFEDWKANASKNVDEKLVKLDFNANDVKPYAKEYLYGFEAENNSIALDSCWDTVKEEISQRLERNIRSSIAADEIRNLDVSSDFKEIDYQYVLLPVWISSYMFQGKVYQVMINGQTGQIKGQAPLSAARILLSILLTVGIAALLFCWNQSLGIVYLVISLIILAVLANRKPRGKKKTK